MVVEAELNIIICYKFVLFYFFAGFLLTVGTLFLGGVLCIVGFLSFGVGTFFALAWLFARAGHRVIGDIRKQAPTIWKFWPSPTQVYNVNGECVKDYGQKDR